MLERISAFFWGPWTLGLFLLTGLYFTLSTRWFQLRCLPLWMKATFGGLFARSGRRGLSPLQTLSTALAATIGTGSIAGVAAAISIGGPGAVFWMELAALLGMMTGCMEKALSVSLRRPRSGGGWLGGPMVWLEQRGLKPLARIFACCTLVCSLGMGCLVQSNSIAAGLNHAFGWSRPAIGAAVALCAGLTLKGGLDRVGSVCERLVPLMALLFFSISAAALMVQRQALPQALSAILTGAFSPGAGIGGGVGTVIRCGVARSVFTNEAGLGTTAMIHANSAGDDPFREGLWGIFEVFLSTVVVCTLTALVILTAPPLPDSLTGAARTSAAFASALGQIGPRLLALCLTLFAFSSILGSCNYGLLGLEYLGLSPLQRWYLPVFLLCCLAGSVLEVAQVWHLADLCTALMAWPSLTALLLYRKKLTKIFLNTERNLSF